MSRSEMRSETVEKPARQKRPITAGQRLKRALLALLIAAGGYAGDKVPEIVLDPVVDPLIEYATGQNEQAGSAEER